MENELGIMGLMKKDYEERNKGKCPLGKIVLGGKLVGTEQEIFFLEGK